MSDRFLNFDTNRWVSLYSPTHKKLMKLGKVNQQGVWLEETKPKPKDKEVELPKISEEDFWTKWGKDPEPSDDEEESIVI